jgi:hypothetical protein
MARWFGLLRWCVPIGCATLWAASLALPAISPSNGQVLTGFDALVKGWQGAQAGVYSWFANPLFVFASIASVFGRFRTAAVLAGFAVLLALTSFAASALARNRGIPAPELGFGPGFYLWLAAQAGLALWCAAALGLHGHGAGGKKFPLPGENRD